MTVLSPDCRLASRAVGSAAVSVDMELTRSDFSITWKLGSLWSTAVRGRLVDISQIGVVVEGVRKSWLVSYQAQLSVLNEKMVLHSMGCESHLVTLKWQSLA